MKKVLQLEEIFMFAACLYFYPYFEVSWWWFGGLILLPDIGMAGYLINARTGAYTYNFLHHRGVAIMVGFAGILLSSFELQFTGYLLFAHSCMDRMLGYGLKYKKGFKFTHLGEIGNTKHITDQPV